MEEFDINRVKLLLLAFLIFTISSFAGAAATLTVAADGTGNYATIQAAINSAASGDVILVKPGTYYENIDLSRVSVELRSSSGNPDDTIIASNNTLKNVISVVSRADVKIQGFTISGAAVDYSGIRLTGCRNCVIENNKFIDNGMGVFVDSSTSCIVRNNVATRNVGESGRGINVEKSYYTTVSGNTISNQRYGIWVANSDSNTVSVNTVSHSAGNGIHLEGGTTNTVLEGNNVNSNGNKGIYLAGASNKNTVKGNTVSSNAGNGIDLERSTGCTVSGNTVSGNSTANNTHGIFLNTCNDNYVQNNDVGTCDYGIAMRYSQNNTVTSNNAHDNDRGIFVAYQCTKNTISGNKATSSSITGIVVTLAANNIVVENNEVSSNLGTGISLDNTTGDRVSKNIITQNGRGIFSGALSSGNIISENTLDRNTGDGMRFESSTNNDILYNVVSSSNGNGIFFASSSNNNDVIGNTLKNSKVGIELRYSNGTNIYQNTVTENTISGIALTVSTNNTIFKNTAFSNVEGITLNSSESNNVSSNNVSSNSNGIYLCPRSYYNQIYNNYFNNPYNTDVRNNMSHWYITKTKGKNVMGGPNLGGNFWGSPSGMGFSETNPDTDGDGIINSNFTSANGNVVDLYPLARVIVPIPSFTSSPTGGYAPLFVQFTDSSQNALSWSWNFGDGNTSTEKNPNHTYSTPGTYTVTLAATNANDTVSTSQTISVQKFVILPVADFSASATSGNAPLTVQFTDLSQNAVAWSWNFGDGSTSTEKSPAHTFNSAGTYTVNLVTGNENGTSPTAKTATITVTTSSSGGGSSGSHSSSSGSSGSSGGSGGGAGSPEPAKNVKVKELCQVFITSGKAVKFDFTKNATAIVNLNFDAKKTVGKTTTIIEMLKNKSTLTPETPEGEVYNYLNIWVGNGGYGSDEDNLENAVINFRVEKSWVQDKGIDQSSIVLNRYSDKKWNELPTTLSGEDSKYLYFKAEAPGFSPFAITGESTEKEAVTETQPETKDKEENTGSTAANTEQESENKQETSTPEKSSSAPGFEIMYGVAGLLAVFLHKRK